MVSTLLLRGMLAGLLAGLLLFAFGRYFGEPLIDRSITFEAWVGEGGPKAGHVHGGHTHDSGNVAGLREHGRDGTGARRDDGKLVSRSVQSGIGLFTGGVVYATALGGMFALAFAAVHQRASALGPRATSALLALAGFVALYLVPMLKYPASPPAVGEANTIGYRTALYFLMVACSLAAMIGAAVLRKRLAAHCQGWMAAYAAIGFYLLAMIIVGTVLPAVNEVPEAFPAAVLWEFRVASVGMQIVMWATFGVAFGELTQRAWARDRKQDRRAPDFLSAS